MRHEFETILTSYDVMNTQDEIDKGLGSRERGYSIDIKAYFGPIQTNISHAPPN